MDIHIDIELKKKCVEAYNAGQKPKEIFRDLYHEAIPTTSYETFRRALRNWRSKIFPDATTLERGTYEGFTAHNATVQVNTKGEIVKGNKKPLYSISRIERQLLVIN
mgnify:CR=1 FL=1